MKKEITIYELLGLIKDKKVPKKIKYDKNIFVFRNNGYEYENGNVGFFDEYKDKLLYNTKSFLNDKVEIIEEPKELEELKEIKTTGDKFYCEYIGSWIKKEASAAYCEYLSNKINEIIRYIKYKENKNEED